METYLISDFDKITQAINGAPATRNFFGLFRGETPEINNLQYKGKREEFINELKKFFSQETTSSGVYTVKNGGNPKATRAFFNIQKGAARIEDFKTLPKLDDSPSIALVKENAELKAELAYLKLRFAEMEAELSEQESDLAEQEEIKNEQKPNAWANLAEQLIPVAAQLAATIASKYLTPQFNGEPRTSERPMAPGYPGPNAQFTTPPIQYRRPNYSATMEGNNNSRPAYGNDNLEANQEE
jgi:hypothetical protein